MSQALAETSVVPSTAAAESHAETAIERIRDALRGLRFGTVSVIVQDGAVVQVERTEKLRLLKRERGQ
jgi:hypothetical protein